MNRKLTIFILLALTAFSFFLSADRRFIVLDEHIYPVEVTEKNGIQYVQLNRIKDIFNAKLTYDSARDSFIYNYRNRQAILAPGKTLISIEGRLEFISNPTFRDKNVFYVPLEFITKILPLLHHTAVEYNSASKAYLFGENADPYQLKVNLLKRNNYQRLIIQAKKSIAFRITRQDEIIKIRFLRRIVILPFNEKSFNRDIVRKLTFKQKGDSTSLEVLLRDEPSDIKSYRFDSPFRIVIDFLRDDEDSDIKPRTFTDNDDSESTSDWLESTELKTIVIDPGHGGSNDGAIGPSGLKEKIVTLELANRLKRIIEENIAGVKVVLTRQRDMDLSLKARTEVANNNKADLFISLHCNGSIQRSARGAEVFILSADASDEAARVLANLENTANGDSAVSERTSLAPILWELAQNEYLRESAQLANMMQAELNQLLNTPERGVKQAPFKVLTGAIMPSVLVEVAFITNPEEETQLKNSNYQRSVANAIYRSIIRFNQNRQRRVGAGY